MTPTDPQTETVSVVQSESSDHEGQPLLQTFALLAARRRARCVESLFLIGYRDSRWCRKYNAEIYTHNSNVDDTVAAPSGRADSLPGNPARPAAAGSALDRIMTEHATGRGYTTSAYESTASQDAESPIDCDSRLATDGGISQPVETTRCGASSAIEGICREPATHEVEINAPNRGHAVDRRCATCAENARGRPYVREVRPITLAVDAYEAAAAIYDHYRYTRATHARIGYTPAVRVVSEEERLHVSRGGLLYLDDRTREAGWRGAHILLEDAPGYFDVTRPTWADTGDWLDAASSCVRETITDNDGRTWSLPTEEIADALQQGTFLEEESR